MSATPKRREPLAGGSSAQSRDNGATTIATGRKPFQGNAGNARNGTQRAPVYAAPPGSDAARDLARLWTVRRRQ